MFERDYVALQERFGGRWVACRGDEVVADAKSYDDLADMLEATDWPEDIIVGYVEPGDVIRVY